MICDKRLGFGKQFHSVPDVTCKKAAILNSALSVQLSMKKSQSFWKINKLTRLCSETIFSKNSYKTETS